MWKRSEPMKGSTFPMNIYVDDGLEMFTRWKSMMMMMDKI